MGEEEERILALRDCLSTLPDRQREVLQQRYRDDSPIRDLAERFGKKESAMKMSLMRTRQALLGK
jgi:RNA polymerase sigma factor (sigma-70 family)